MILIELICKFAEWLWQYILKPLIRFSYWLATARDCKHCKNYRVEKGRYFDGQRYCRNICDKNDKSCFCTACYGSITRKDFERKKQ